MPNKRILQLIIFSLILTFSLTDSQIQSANAGEEEYYKIISVFTPKSATDSRSKKWKPAPKGLSLEVSGMAKMDDGKMAVTIRKGEIWILDGIYDIPAKNVTYKRFASGLHEPLGLLRHNDSFYTVQRTELTRIRDLDGDGVADEYKTIAKGWGVTGNYHEYAFGPKMDHEGNLWLTLNIGMGFNAENKKRMIMEPTLKVSQGRWRGWGMKVTPDGKLVPVCAGMRSPSGIGTNRAGDMFYTDQQGNWVGTNTVHHMRKGAFFHHPESLASMILPDSPIKGIKKIPNGIPYPKALEQFPQMKPPVVWLPYKKIGQSPTDILLDKSNGKFGPFQNQFFIGEFTLSSINRVFVEKIKGEYQGACFPFREGFASAVLRMVQGKDGSLFAGLSNRGWSSLGTASYGLERLVWTGKTPFEIKEMKAKSDGFDIVFTKPVDPKTAVDPKSWSMNSYTYTYQAGYGSDEIEKKDLKIDSITVSSNKMSVHLKISGLRKLYVHELHTKEVKSASGESVLHPRAYYTLNQIP